MQHNKLWLDLQLFGGEGAAGDGGGDGAATSGDNDAAPDAGEARLRELGVPEHMLAKRAKKAKNPPAMSQAESARRGGAASQDAADNDTAPASEEQTDKPTRMTWDEIMSDPEYNKQMQQTIQARLKSAKSAESDMAKMRPAIELLTRRYGLDADNLDVEALTKAISNDDAYYEDMALEMGVSVETAKRIDQQERENRRLKAEQQRSIEEQRIRDHLTKLHQQGEALKQTFPQFDLAAELQNPAFARMTSPNVGVSVEDAYYAIHRKEIQQAAMQVTAQKTAQQMSNAIRANASRPVENGTSGQAPTTSTFDYSRASKEQREALKRQIREAAAKGQKIYPGQFSFG